jgi:hypothetical protein
MNRGPEMAGNFLGNLKPRDAINMPHKTIKEYVGALIDKTRADVSQRIPLYNEVQKRVENAIENRLYPYIVEGEVIGTQLNSPEYQQHIVETDQFLEAKVAAIACPDGRILVIQLGDPKVMSVSRKLQGLPATRPSTKESSDRMVPDDPYISAAIRTDMERRKKANRLARIVQFVGPHIHSLHPVEHGCGDKTTEMVAYGHTPEIGMRFGGIPEYYTKLGKGFNAFDNAAENAGGRGATFDLVHDAYSQGIILGLRNSYEKFNHELSLRNNLELLAKNKNILMTEFLDPIFAENIIKEAQKRGITHPIDISNFYNFGQNAILIGEIARNITIEQEKENFPWIPESIKEDKTEVDVRVAAYHSIRNVVYRIMGGIKPGEHNLQEHPEKLIRVGPIGADFNVKNIPFIESTVPGQLQSSDMEAVDKLYRLSYGVLKAQGINLENEARIILVTGIYDEKLYADKDKAQEQLNLSTHIVQNNAAWIRGKFEKSIKTGETIVIGALHEPGNRRLSHIV